MPIVHAHVWEGWGAENAKVLIEKFTHTFEELGVPREAVDIVVHETPKSHWGVGGQACSERFKDVQPGRPPQGAGGPK
jgi:4-oxalocrotonate tautomerase